MVMASKYAVSSNTITHFPSLTDQSCRRNVDSSLESMILSMLIPDNYLVSGNTILCIPPRTHRVCHRADIYCEAGLHVAKLHAINYKYVYIHYIRYLALRIVNR